MAMNSPRHADHAIDPMFLERWSPRAFTGEPIARGELFRILEAARWAPSASNVQPWRFVYALRNTPSWDRLLGLLNESNQAWAKTASALIVIVSKATVTSPGSDKTAPSYTHSFDTGAAWMSLALQARLSGWYAHGMIGLDIDRAYGALGVPESYRVEAAVAIGRKADPSTLPERLRAREKPSDRLPLAEMAFEGMFKS